MKKEAELYLKENYKADWIPKTRVEKFVESQAPSSTTNPTGTQSPSSLLSAPTNGKKKTVPIHLFFLLLYFITRYL